jgi:hypothetical protein
MGDLKSEVRDAMYAGNGWFDQLPVPLVLLVQGWVQAHGREATLVAMRELVEPFEEDRVRSEPTSGSGIADQIYIGVALRCFFLTESIKYVESLPA